MKRDHLCTRRCLRWQEAFGRRWYYCKDVPAVVVRVSVLKPKRTAGRALDAAEEKKP